VDGDRAELGPCGPVVRAAFPAIVGSGIVGVGGIMNATDAVEFILAGASAIQIGCANFVKPAAAMEVLDGLKEYCVEHNFSSLRRLVGALEIN